MKLRSRINSVIEVILLYHNIVNIILYIRAFAVGDPIFYLDKCQIMSEDIECVETRVQL